MKKAKGINKLIVLVMLVTMAFLSMGVSSWLIISENGFFPGFSPLITPTVDTSGFNTSGTATYNIYGREETIPGVTITGENGETLTGTFETAQTKLTSGNSVTLNAATIKFIPDSEYSDTYSEVTFTLTANITLKAVAKRGDAYYTTIDAALQATSGNEIIVTETFSEYCTFKNVTASTSVTAYTNLLALTVKTAQEVKSGVTLILPCAPETTDKEDDELSETTDLKHVKQFKSGVYKQTNEDKRGNNAPATNLYSNISVANGHTLTNNGTILIGGVISGGGAHSSINSMTIGAYGQITMGDSSTLKNTTNGKIECYGYIDEKSNRSGSELLMEGGTLYTMFSVIEHQGGSALLGMVDPEQSSVKSELIKQALAGFSGVGEFTPNTMVSSPFNRFFFEGVVCEIKVEYNAMVKGYCDLTADGGENCAIMDLIGKDSTFMIQLTHAKSKVEIKFNKTKTAANEYTRKHDLQVYGNMKLNTFSMSLVITKAGSTIKINLSSQYFHFPIPDSFDITLNKYKAEDGGANATVDLTSQKIKLLPGSVLNIEDGVTVNAGSIAIYENNETLQGVYPVTGMAYSNNEPAQVNVKGTLIADALGGKVNTCGTNGKFKANTNIVISKEISKHNTGAKLDLTVTEIGYTSIEYANTNLMANGNLWYLGASALSTNTQYYSAIQEDSEFAWYTLGNKVITYNTNGGNEIASKTVSVSNSSTGYLLTASDLPTPTKQFYTFEGWYRDINCTQKVEVGTAIYADITLYAKWSGKTYTINFVPNNGLAEYSETFIYTEDKGGLALPDHDKVEGYDFSCWYTDEDLTIPVSSYKEALAQINGTSTSISLYGEWVGGYTVKFFINNAEYTGTVSNINHGTINEFTASEIPVALTDTNTKYFMGWYYNGNEIRDWSFMDVGTTTYNINAQWGQKYHLIINASNSNATVGTSIQINKEEFYLNPDQLDAKFTALNNIAKAQDNVVGTNKYFVGWTNVNTGTLIGSLAANVFTDYKLTITANWGEKATLTITASKASSGYLGLGSEHSTITVMQGGQTILTVKSNGTTSASTYICPGSTITYKYTFDTLTATETNWRGQTSATHNARISVGSTVISSGLSTSSSNIDLVVTSSITIKAYYT